MFLHPTFFIGAQAAANCAPDASREIEQPNDTDQRNVEPEIAVKTDAVLVR
ncbi:hypothetical protein [Rhizobium sp. NFR07]|uniref:hypothetical protein n=1 Tax=Rhizobium sp. NFR07 TaxID=1566262 RepID=UPI0015A62828|nr:hypothetical protein [Rhizobium sp. NFR07]